MQASQLGVRGLQICDSTVTRSRGTLDQSGLLSHGTKKRLGMLGVEPRTPVGRGRSPTGALPS